MELFVRILLSSAAWLVTHFIGFIIFSIIYNERVPLGLLAILDWCAAIAVFYFVKGKQRQRANKRSSQTSKDLQSSNIGKPTQTPNLITCQSCNKLYSERADKCPQCSTKKIAPTKQCKICESLISTQSSVCPECGDPEPFESNGTKHIKNINSKVTDEKRNLEEIRKAGIKKLADAREQKAARHAAEVAKVSAAVEKEMTKRNSSISDKNKFQEEINKLEKQIDESCNIHEMNSLQRKINEIKKQNGA
jgi:RNA polymerase subunit RPABC4/transcription elongation factor Spt4